MRTPHALPTFVLSILLSVAGWSLVEVPRGWTDTLELHLGGQVVGQSQLVKEDGVDRIHVTMEDGFELILPSGRVSRVTASADRKMASYRRAAADAGNDAQAHWELARKCTKLGFSDQFRYHLQRAIAIDPDHKQARASLGYQRDSNGKWVNRIDLNRRRGLVYTGGVRWETPELNQREKYRDEVKKRTGTWNRDLTLMIRNVERDRPNALAALQAISDPLATKAITSKLESGQGSRQRRLLWVTLLGRFKTSASVQTLVKTAMNDQDARIRSVAITQLREFGQNSAVGHYLAYLRSDSAPSTDVDNAARVLQSFPDSELALDYVNGLVSVSKNLVGGGAGITGSFGSGGGGGLSTGSKPQEVRQEVRNPEVHALLRMIEPNADYGYNEDAWRRHFAGQRSHFEGDLRRDP